MKGEFPLLGSTVAKVKVDQILVGEPGFNRQRLEICDGLPIETYRDGLLQQPDVGIIPSFHFGKVVVFSHGSAPIFPLLNLIRLSRGKDADHRFLLAIAVTHNQCAQPETYAQKNKPSLILGMIRIRIDLCILVQECGLGLLERHSVLALVGSALPLVPDKTDRIHMYNVCKRKFHVNIVAPME